MANLGPSGFDATGIEPTSDFDVLPPAWYVAEVSASDMRPNSKGTGEYLWLEFTVLDGPYASRKVWTQLNLINPSPQAVEIAQRELSGLCRAAGKLRVQDSIELHGIPLEVNVKIKNDSEYGKSNVIRGFREKGGGSKQSTAGAAATPNWKRPAAPSSNGSTAGTPVTTAAPAPAAPPPVPAPVTAPVTSAPTPPWKKR